MRSVIKISILASRVPVLLLLSTMLVASQITNPIYIKGHAKEWQRVVTAPDSNIEVSNSSLILGPDHVLSAKFQTILSKSEEAFEKAGVKYRTRLETIQFDAKNYSYRVIETVLLDSSEKPVFNSGPMTNARWRPIGFTARKLYEAASELPPFASWRVSAIRYADGKPATGDDDDARVNLLLKSYVTISFVRFGIGREVCSLPSYESGSLSDAEFAKWTGQSLKAAGLAPEKIDALKITCGAKNGSSELHFLFFGSAGKATLLSGGFLLDLEKLDR